MKRSVSCTTETFKSKLDCRLKIGDMNKLCQPLTFWWVIRGVYCVDRED